MMIKSGGAESAVSFARKPEWRSEHGYYWFKSRGETKRHMTQYHNDQLEQPSCTLEIEGQVVCCRQGLAVEQPFFEQSSLSKA